MLKDLIEEKQKLKENGITVDNRHLRIIFSGKFANINMC